MYAHLWFSVVFDTYEQKKYILYFSVQFKSKYHLADHAVPIRELLLHDPWVVKCLAGFSLSSREIVFHLKLMAF